VVRYKLRCDSERRFDIGVIVREDRGNKGIRINESEGKSSVIDVVVIPRLKAYPRVFKDKYNYNSRPLRTLKDKHTYNTRPFTTLNNP